MLRLIRTTAVAASATLLFSLPLHAQTPPPNVVVPEAPASVPANVPASVPATVPPSSTVTRTANGERHTLNLKAADIGVLIQTVSEITGKSFIVDPRVEGRVTVISAKPQAAAEIYETFLSVLRVHGCE